MVVERFPAGEAVQRASAAAEAGGGPVATAMVGLARLGARAAMVDALGEDRRGDQILEDFRREGVSTHAIKVRKGHSSSVAAILVRREDGARSIVYRPGSAPPLTEEELPEGIIRSAGFLHLNGRHWEACLAAARLAQEAGVRVSFDGGAHRYRPELRALIPMVDVCIVARSFARRYTGEGEPMTAGRRLLEEGPDLVVITGGAGGSWVVPSHGAPFHQAAHEIETVVDTTGGGDAFHAGFLYGLLRGWELERVAAFASAVGAMNCRALGGREALPTLAEVEAFLEGW
jgi:sugar/nucleoside kinase (ribokinase family)